MPGFTELAQHLTQALKALQMYQAQHPRSQEALQAAQQTLEALLAGRSPLQLNVSNGKAFIDGQPQEGASPHVTFLVRQLSERQVAGFVFERGFSPEELLGMLETLLLKPARIEEAGGVSAILESKGIRRIHVSTTQYREVGSDEAASGAFPAVGASGAFRVQGGPEGSGETPALRSPASDTELLAAALRETLLSLMQKSGEGLILPRPGEESPLTLAPPPPSLFPNLGSKLGLAGGGSSGPGASGAFTAPGPGASGGFTAPGPGGSGGFSASGQGGAATLGVPGLGAGLGAGAAAPALSTAQLGGLRQAVMALPAPQQLSLLAGLGQASGEAAGLASGMRPMIPEVLATAIATLLQQGFKWTQLESSVSRILKPFEDRAAIAASVGMHLQGMGLDAGPLGGLMATLDWEEVSLESKVARLLEGGKLLEISSDHRLAFLRDLLDKRMDEGFLRGLDLLLEALKSTDPDTRRSAAQTLAGVTRWALEPRLPSEAEKIIRQRLPRPFINEVDPSVHRWISEALSEMVLVWLETGDLAQGTEAVEALRQRMEADAANYPWRIQAMADFEARIQSPRGREAALTALYRTEREQLLVEVEPYLRWQGLPMAKRLVERLEQEQDRTKRGRIMDGLRLMGDQALPPLEEALKSPAWFLVRNAMLLLSELGNQGHLPKIVPLLRHSEPRVCRTAVRVIWKLGGPAAEQPLLHHLLDADPETQAEIFFALGQIHGDASGPAMIEIAADRKAPERLRLECLKLLQGLKSPKAVPGLVELIKRRGLFGTGAESGSIRVAAAQALAAVGTPEARANLQRIVEAEPRGLERDIMAKLLAS
ncbi:MAG TPA: HEAT repeat domain-containing protein [Holophagaceae bacterium]|nr:HEAT repeat domain-containing protein [Holophagaceae bacterium]